MLRRTSRLRSGSTPARPTSRYRATPYESTMLWNPTHLPVPCHTVRVDYVLEAHPPDPPPSTVPRRTSRLRSGSTPARPTSRYCATPYESTTFWKHARPTHLPVPCHAVRVDYALEARRELVSDVEGGWLLLSDQGLQHRAHLVGGAQQAGAGAARVCVC